MTLCLASAVVDGMTAITRAVLGRLMRRPEPPWRVGERVVIAACDRRTGRPERPAVEFTAVVESVSDMIVTVSVGAGKPYHFLVCDGWEVFPGAVSPWRLLHDGGWRF